MWIDPLTNAWIKRNFENIVSQLWIQFLEMVRSRKRTIRNALLFCLFLYVFLQLYNGSSGWFEDADIMSEAYSSELILELDATARRFPGLETRLQRIGPGIDPRTADLKTRTLHALVWPLTYSCAMHEGIFDRFVSVPGLIPRYMYIREISIIRTVIEMTLSNQFEQMSQGNKVTLLTQITSDRIYVLNALTKSWSGPMVTAIYTSRDMFLPVHKQLSIWLTNLQRPDVLLLLVETAGMLYPVNWLRNLALSRAQSQYVFMIDGDFLPSAGLHDSLIAHFHSQPPGSVFLVPAFEMMQGDAKIPETREQLIEAVQNGKAEAFHKGEFVAAHQATDYRRWYLASAPYTLPTDRNNCDEHFEPYLVIERTRSPFFPETLLERRKNKIAYQYELCVCGYKFTVLHDAFLIHKAHPKSMRATASSEKCVYIAWDVFMRYVRKYSVPLA